MLYSDFSDPVIVLNVKLMTIASFLPQEIQLERFNCRQVLNFGDLRIVIFVIALLSSNFETESTDELATRRCAHSHRVGPVVEPVRILDILQQVVVRSFDTWLIWMCIDLLR